jgi:hypothetical protein
MPLIIVLSLALVIGIVLANSGYKLFTAKSHFTVEEGVQVQYWSGTEWLLLTVNGGTFDLGTATIKPGETNRFTLRAKNNALSGTIGLKLEIGSADGITHDVACNTVGEASVEYTDTGDFLFKLPSDSAWRSVDITTTASGDIGLGNVEFDNNLYRQGAETSYAVTCP